jgi:DNA-binding beta-propeller fold protein YncE
MELINYQKKNRLGEITVVVISFFLILFLFLFIPAQINAQQMGALVTYEDSIYFDEEESRLITPFFVMAAPATDEIYLIDGKSRIIIYTSDLFPLYTIRKNKYFQAPQGLALDIEGNLYVAQSATPENPRGRISVFSACLKWERDIYMEGFEGSGSFVPYRLAVDKKGNIYVVANNFPALLIMDRNGAVIDKISPEEKGENVSLNSVTLDETGRIYLVSESAGRIYVYDEHRKFIYKFGEKGGSSGKLSRPKNVAVDVRNGRKYVVDYMRHSITVYNEDGEFFFEFGGLGWGEGWFQYPTDIAIDKDGRIFVADLYNQRVQVFRSW